MLDLYRVVEVKGKQYVRKERLDELQGQFDAVCDAHTEFVNKVHAAIHGTKRDWRGELRKLIAEYGMFLGDADAEPKRQARRLYGALQILLTKLTCLHDEGHTNLLCEQEATANHAP